MRYKIKADSEQQFLQICQVVERDNPIRVKSEKYKMLSVEDLTPTTMLELETLGAKVTTETQYDLDVE